MRSRPQCWSRLGRIWDDLLAVQEWGWPAWLRLLQRDVPTARLLPAPKSRKPPRVRLQLDALETRLVPTAYVYTDSHANTSPSITFSNLFTAVVVDSGVTTTYALTSSDTFEFDANAANESVTVSGSGMPLSPKIKGSTNTTLGSSSSTTWTLSGANAGYITAGALSFTSITNLVGSNNDTWILNTGASGMNITQTAGTPTIEGTTASETWNVTGVNAGNWNNTITFSGMTSLTGNGSTSTLAESSGTNTWNVTGNNAGNIFTGGSTTAVYTNMTTLKGGSGSDTFKFSGGSAMTITGGSGTETLDYSASSTTSSVTIGGVAPYVGTWSGINILVGKSGMTLIGSSTGSTFTLTGTNAGTITGGYTFSAFSTLQGGSGGGNTLTESSGNNTWNATANAAGTLNGTTTYSNFSTLHGGSGSDVFKILGNGNAIVGGSGNETIDFSGYSGSSATVQPTGERHGIDRNL